MVRDEFLLKIKEIQVDPTLSVNTYNSETLVYGRESRSPKEFEINESEYSLLRNLSSFFNDDTEIEPEIKGDKVALEVFTHFSSDFLEESEIEEVQYLDDMTEKEIGKRMGPIEPTLEKYENITFHQSLSWSFIGLSFHDPYKCLNVFRLKDKGDLKAVITGGFPLPYLVSLVKDPFKLDWKHTSEDIFSLYMREFANQEEKKKLLKAYL